MKAREGRLRAALDYDGAADENDPQPRHERDELGVPLCGADDACTSEFAEDGPPCPACTDVRADIEGVAA